MSLQSLAEWSKKKLGIIKSKDFTQGRPQGVSSGRGSTIDVHCKIKAVYVFKKKKEKGKKSCSNNESPNIYIIILIHNNT